MLQIFKIGFIGLCVIVDDILPIYWQLACRLNIGKGAHKIALFIEVPTKHQEFSLFCDMYIVFHVNVSIGEMICSCKVT